MAKPVLSSVNVFDATVGALAYFRIYVSYTSPSIIKEYEYTIYDGSDDKIVCTSSGAYRNLLYSQNVGWGFRISTNPALVNREENYYMRIRVKLNGESDFGEYSSPVVLYCKERPTITFSGLQKQTENIVQMSATVFELAYTYKEEQSETLKTYKYEFYNSDKKLIDETKTYYGSISHSFSVYGLETDSLYYVRGLATTRNGYELDTGYYPIRVSGSISNGDYAFGAENDRYNAAIRLTSHFISVSGSPNGEYSYVKTEDEKYAVDLTNGTKVTYFLKEQNGNLVNFDMKFVVKANSQTDIAELNWQSDNHTVSGSVSVRERAFTDIDDISSKVFATLNVKVDGETYLVIESNYLNSNGIKEYLFVDLVCIDGYFDLYIEPVGINGEEYKTAILDNTIIDFCLLGSGSKDE